MRSLEHISLLPTASQFNEGDVNPWYNVLYLQALTCFLISLIHRSVMLYKECGHSWTRNIHQQVMSIGIAYLFNYYLIILWVSVMFTCFCILLFKTYKIYVEFLIEFQHHIQTFQLKITETYFILATSVINYCIKILSDNSTQNIFGIFLYQNKYLTISCIFRSGCYFRLWRERKFSLTC